MHIFYSTGIYNYTKASIQVTFSDGRMMAGTDGNSGTIIPHLWYSCIVGGHLLTTTVGILCVYSVYGNCYIYVCDVVSVSESELNWSPCTQQSSTYFTCKVFITTYFKGIMLYSAKILHNY